MRVKIGDKIYDSEDQPIMVILTDGDKTNIECMVTECSKYCEYNDNNYTPEQISAWMDIEEGTEVLSSKDSVLDLTQIGSNLESV